MDHLCIEMIKRFWTMNHSLFARESLKNYIMISLGLNNMFLGCIAIIRYGPKDKLQKLSTPSGHRSISPWLQSIEKRGST